VRIPRRNAADLAHTAEKADTSLDARDRRLLFIDMCYSLEAVRARGLHQFFHARHSGDYFTKVWGVHPMADRAGTGPRRDIRFIEFSPNQIVIEGAAELYPWPAFLLPLNLVCSQARLLRRLVRLIHDEDISAIAAVDPFYTGLVGVILKRICRKPLIVHVIANYDDLYDADGTLAMPQLLRFRWVEKALARAVYSRADLVAAGTPTLMDYAVRNGADVERVRFFPLSKTIHPIHFTVPGERLDPDEELKRLNVPPADHYLLTVSRIVPSKKVVDALKAMKIVMDEEPSVIGLFVGEGPQRQELERLASAYGVADRVRFLGILDQETLSRVMPRCISVAPLPGMTLFESALAGSPTVAYNRDALIAALVIDGETGFLTDFADYQTLGKKTLELVRNPSLRARLGANIRENALPYVDLESLYRREREAFDEILATTTS
jgi:glycosyltransferase involved in cell wall biosynthesis